MATIREDAEFALRITSHDFRDAFNSAWDEHPDTYQTQVLTAEDIIYRAICNPIKNADIDWNLKRLATFASLHQDVGQFGRHFASLQGAARPSDLRIEDLDNGQIGPVATNSKIMSISQEITNDPIRFLELSLQLIDSRKYSDIGNVGPENYATTLKFFTDLQSEISGLDNDKIAELVKKACEGFALISKKDKPNFVEMTNIYTSIRRLPKNIFPADFAPVLVGHSLEQLPTYNRKMVDVMLNALAKISLEECDAQAAILIDLGLRLQNGFETTKEMRSALRAIANLKKSEQAKRAFETFIELRNNLEEPVDMFGAAEVNKLLLNIIKNTVDDKDLTIRAKEIAGACASTAVRLLKEYQSRSEGTEAEARLMEGVVLGAVDDWSKI